MAVPSNNDIQLYDGVALTDVDWDINFKQIVLWLNDGNADFVINSLKCTLSIEAVTGAFSGQVTAGSFVGDGSGITGIDEHNHNFLINGGARIVGADPSATIMDSTYTEPVSRFSGTGVSVLGTIGLSSTLLQVTDTTNVGNTEFAVKFENVTIDNADGLLFLRTQIFSNTAVNFINQAVSFSFQAFTDINPLSYTVFYRIPTVKNNFDNTTDFANSGATVLNSGGINVFLNTVLDDSLVNGLEIEIQFDVGLITTKNLEITQLQLEIGITNTVFEYRTIQQEYAMDNYDNDGNQTVTGDSTVTGDLTVGNDSSIGNDLAVGNDLTVGNDITATNDINAGNNLDSISFGGIVLDEINTGAETFTFEVTENFRPVMVYVQCKNVAGNYENVVLWIGGNTTIAEPTSLAVNSDVSLIGAISYTSTTAGVHTFEVTTSQALSNIRIRVKQIFDDNLI